MPRAPAAPAPVPVPASPVTVAPPEGPAPPVGSMPEWSAAQILEQVRPRFDAFTSAGYGLGVAFLELSRPGRYRDELGYGSFEELLEGQGLGTRMTAYKYMTVVPHYSSTSPCRRASSPRRAYIIRGLKAENPEADPRIALEPGSRVAGVDVHASTGRQIRDAVRGLNSRPRPSGRPIRPDTKPMRRAAGRFRSAMKRADIPARVRVHSEDGKPCVGAHFDAGPALRVAQLVRAALAHATPPP
ncbi:MAG: hypothetical protein IT373_29365 [Polyangiaceae bacterium]|nr:hypothetical protein [Polyangiaceae bacterium]